MPFSVFTLTKETKRQTVFSAVIFFLCVSDSQVLEDIHRVVGDDSYSPQHPKELCAQIFTTCYMASENSSEDTCNRARDLASQIGR